MPKINLCFQGWLQGIEVNQIFATGELETPINVSNISSQQLVRQLQSGEWAISLKEALNTDCDDEEIEIFDYEDNE